MTDQIHRKTGRPIICLMIILLVLVGTNNVMSQNRNLQRTQRSTVRPEVGSLNINELTLTQGGDEAIIIIDGKNMDQVKKAQLFRGTRGRSYRSRTQSRIPHSKVEVKIVEATPTQLTLSLKATQLAALADNYYLQLQDTRENNISEIINYDRSTRPNPKLLKISVARGSVAATRQPAAAPRQPVTQPRQPVTAPRRPVTAGRQIATPQPTTPAAGIASKALTGQKRWSKISMHKRTSTEIIPKYLGGAARPISTPKNASSGDRTMNVNKRAVLSFKKFEILDPGKSTATPINPNTVFNLPNGESLTAKAYYSELNRVEQEFNKLGYSLDKRRQPQKIYDFARITKATPAFKPRTGMAVKGTEFLKAPTAVQQKFTKRMQSSQKVLFSSAQTASAKQGKAQKTQAQKQTLAAKPAAQRAKTVQTAKRANVQQAVAAAAADLKPNPYNKTVRHNVMEFGNRDLFAGYLRGQSEIKATPGTMEILNSAGLGTYVFGHDFKIISVGTTTKSAYSNGKLQFLFTGTIGPHNVSIPITEKTVPNKQPSEMSPLPKIESGWQSFQPVDFDYSCSATFMAGPIPITIRAGTSVAAGINYSLGATPVFNGNLFVPWVHADAYGQAGIDLLIMGAGAGCNIILLDGYMRILGMMERNGNWIDVDYEISRNVVICAGNLYAFFFIYVPAFALPPWEKKEFRLNIVDWDGWKKGGYAVQSSERHQILQ